jgi:hypothetical protein
MGKVILEYLVAALVVVFLALFAYGVVWAGINHTTQFIYGLGFGVFLVLVFMVRELIYL